MKNTMPNRYLYLHSRLSSWLLSVVNFIISFLFQKFEIFNPKRKYLNRNRRMNNSPSPTDSDRQMEEM